LFFFASKAFWFLAQPLVLAAVCCIVGFGLLFSRWHRTGRAVVGIAAVLLAAVSFLPLGEWLIAPLEDRFPPYRADGRPVYGIIVLGGGSDMATSFARGRIALNDAGDRFAALTALARRYPAARLVFSGGSGDPFDQARGEAETVPGFLAEQGIDPARLIVESRSRNTWENARFSVDMLRPDPGQHWLLVTSAYHMPRAVGCFRTAGGRVTPYPVDYRTTGRRRWISLQPTDNLRLLTDAWREWIGLLAYRLAGHTGTVFPAPEETEEAS
jgi:uncharacterized SAM-binding protein YcdF (DUF218 family)